MPVPSELTQDRIADSFGRPEYVSISNLPFFSIRQLEGSGFSARRYAVWFQMELARPLFLTALVILAASFTMRHTRLANTGVSVLVAIMLGFGLHYIRNFAQILGENGQIPVLLAAWAPPVASLLLAVGILLHMEEGMTSSYRPSSDNRSRRFGNGPATSCGTGRDPAGQHRNRKPATCIPCRR
ncbi:MAG: LptF/LptG family permease [Roseovarius pacificus]|nr:LptF/LptG family permease [Roseovarius pacificus]